MYDCSLSQPNLRGTTPRPAQAWRACAALAALLLATLVPVAHADDVADCNRSATLEAQIAACTRVIESGRLQGANLVRAYDNRGLAKQGKGDLDGAIADYTSALELDPKNADLIYYRAMLKSEKGDVDGTIADYTRALELDPRSAYAYYYRGIAKKEKSYVDVGGAKDDLDSAIADFTRAIELDPKYIKAYTNRADARSYKGDFEGAIADYTRALELNPKLGAVYINRGDAKRRRGDQDGAISDYSHAIELNPKDAHAYFNRGDIKWRKGDLEEAIADYTRVIEFEPNHAGAYNNRGVVKKDKGDFNGAIADYDRAIQLDPELAPAYSNRGQATLWMGDPAGAINDLARAQELKADARTTLWLYLARSRAMQDGKKELAANAAKLDGAAWPAQVVALYLGKSTPESVMAAAKNPDPKTKKGQVCQADFYLAEWHLLKNDKRHALPLLRAAAKQCPPSFDEHGAATLELKRLAAK